MAVKIYKPTTSSRRLMSIVAYKGILTRQKPEKALVFGKKNQAGRSKGRVTVRHQGGGAKKRYRMVDFFQDKFDIPAKVKFIEYDPNRSAFIALVFYADGEKRYILAPNGIKVGDEIVSSLQKVAVKTGNRMPLKYIPTTTLCHNVELKPGKGGKIARGAGSLVILSALEDKLAHLKMPSGEIRKVDKNCLASIGSVSNPDHNKIKLGSAGRTRLSGIRPTVRGKAMAPDAHPHGGGEGRSSVGLKHPKTPWGKPAKGVKTRIKKASDKFIVKRR